MHTEKEQSPYSLSKRTYEGTRTSAHSHPYTYGVGVLASSLHREPTEAQPYTSKCSALHVHRLV